MVDLNPMILTITLNINDPDVELTNYGPPPVL